MGQPPVLGPVAPESPEMPEAASAPRTRRSVLAAGIGGFAGLMLGALGLAQKADASAGSPLIIGSLTNNAGTSNTLLQTSSNVVAFELLQNGPGTALMGYASRTSGTTRGVYGRADSAAGAGVQARNAATIHGTGAAIQAIGVNNDGLDASTDSASSSAVHGVNNSAGAVGALAAATPGGVVGALGHSESGVGVQGDSGTGIGVYGASSGGDGVYGQSDTGYALYGDGDGAVTGNFSKAGGSFRIDHPLDPANEYLLHSFVESPDMKNVYDGIATLDENGEATVELPAWFGALNRDFRYQLTAIGASGPDLFVKSEVKANAFSIAGGKARQRVSWQLTGIRKDAWANAHRIVVEEAKPVTERGLYLHPKEHDQPEAKGIPHPGIGPRRVLK